jgi:hypothetical protein
MIAIHDFPFTHFLSHIIRPKAEGDATALPTYYAESIANRYWVFTPCREIPSFPRILGRGFSFRFQFLTFLLVAT